MNNKELSQSAELNSDHGDIDPRIGFGSDGFIIAHEALLHQPAEGALDAPAVWRDFEANEVARTFEDRDDQLWPQPLNPKGKSFAGLAAIHPQDSQPGRPGQQDLGSIAFGSIGWIHSYARHQAQPSNNSTKPLPTHMMTSTLYCQCEPFSEVRLIDIYNCF